MGKKAVVLLSGGLDSAVVLYEALRAGYACSCLIFDYGQRHKREIESAQAVARRAGCAYRVVKITLPWKGSSLLDKNEKILRRLKGIPNTYVPGRNIIFLSFALSCAEAEGAQGVFIGAHAQDYSGYPDCRPEFIKAFEKMARAGTRAGVEGRGIEIKAPLLKCTKAEIVRKGKRFGVPFELTWSCYRGGKRPCGTCDSCRYRAKGFKEARVGDPL